MSWPKIVLVVLYVVSLVITIAMVDKPRKPTTPGLAAFSVFWTAGLIWLVVIA